MSFKTLLAGHDDFPAFRAGFLVVGVLLAALFNTGILLFLIGVHIGLDLVKYREMHQLSWKKTLHGTIRENIVDLALILFLLSLTIAMQIAMHFDPVRVPAPPSVLFIGLLSLFSKALILWHFLRVLLHPLLLPTSLDSFTTEWSRSTRWCLSLVSGAVIVLASLYFVFPGNFAHAILLQELNPLRF